VKKYLGMPTPSGLSNFLHVAASVQFDADAASPRCGAARAVNFACSVYDKFIAPTKSNTISQEDLYKRIQAANAPAVL